MKILLFGATGSAGGSVLNVCLSALSVSEVRVLTRRPLARSHPKLDTRVHGDYLHYGAVADAFTGVDACLFCLGISVRQTANEAEYRTITLHYPVAAAHTLGDAGFRLPPE